MDTWQTAALTVTGLAAGLGIGALIGGAYAVRVFDWETTWAIDAPLAAVYRVMTTPQEQDKWWPSMRVRTYTPWPDERPGGTVVYQVQQAQSVARLVRPFVITSVTEDIEPERRTRSVVTGDLCGVLETLFSARPDGGTQIRFHWYVRMRHPIFNIAGYFLTTMFQTSHDHVMREGERGLQDYLRAGKAP